MTIPALGPYLLYTKSFHVMAIIAWMSGLFYLPRLFVYHCQVARGTEASERFKVMECRLLKQIINPAMIVAWVFGILLILTPGAMDWSAPWWHVKLLGVILMTGFSGVLSKWRRNFMEDRNMKPERYYRFANEIPTVLMVVIVIMAIAQPGG